VQLAVWLQPKIGLKNALRKVKDEPLYIPNTHFKSKVKKTMDAIKFVQEQSVAITNHPPFKAGDTIAVHYKIKEGAKERIQVFQGVVIQRRGVGITETFTIRKMSGSVGVERIIPVNSPNIDHIIVNARGIVRRARLFYLRKLTGKKARIKQKQV
jgi:large subunit ribosomal protein L19